MCEVGVTMPGADAGKPPVASAGNAIAKIASQNSPPSASRRAVRPPVSETRCEGAVVLGVSVENRSALGIRGRTREACMTFSSNSRELINLWDALACQGLPRPLGRDRTGRARGDPLHGARGL